MACNFILWDCKIQIPRPTVKKLIQECKENQEDPTRYFTSYFDKDLKIEYKEECVDIYKNAIDKMLHDFGIWEQCRYYLEHWIQMYSDTNKDYHEPHVHYGGGEFLSWVHFIHTPKKQNCFYFYDGYGRKIYPQLQRSGDFIAFPPWMPHGIDPVTTKGFDRVVVAGNLFMTMLKYGDINMKANSWNNTALFTNYPDKENKCTK